MRRTTILTFVKILLTATNAILTHGAMPLVTTPITTMQGLNPFHRWTRDMRMLLTPMSRAFMTVQNIIVGRTTTHTIHAVIWTSSGRQR